MKILKTIANMFKSKVHDYRKSKVHDYRKEVRGWGHNLSMTICDEKGVTHSGSGWGRGIDDNDVLVLGSKEKGFACYVVDSIHYHSDPPDMWGATIKHAKSVLSNNDYNSLIENVGVSLGLNFEPLPK